MNSAFRPLSLYPELSALFAGWRIIRDEALGSIDQMIGVDDERSERGAWRALPLMPEEEDRPFVPEQICQRGRALAPHTVRLVEELPSLRGFAFSLLRPRCRIRPHRHDNAYVTASLCLQSGGRSYICVDGEKRDYQEGEIIIFDYRLTHEIVNQGDDDRIALLVLLDVRDVQS